RAESRANSTNAANTKHASATLPVSTDPAPPALSFHRPDGRPPNSVRPLSLSAMPLCADLPTQYMLECCRPLHPARYVGLKSVSCIAPSLSECVTECAS